jgi:predicted amidohydrolase
VQLAAAQWLGRDSRLGSSQPQANELKVLPELSGLPAGLGAAGIRGRAESRWGAFETLLAERAKAGIGYLVGSYPEREGSKVFHTVALAGPRGTILGRYRATHLSDSEKGWASAGDAPLVIPTPLGQFWVISGGRRVGTATLTAAAAPGSTSSN